MKPNETQPVRPNNDLQPIEDEESEKESKGRSDEIDKESDNEDDDIKAEEEGVKHKEVRPPGEPSKSEVEHHEMTHIPYRSWCAHCVRGRGKSAHHPNKTKDEDKADRIPMIEIDYCFQKKESETKHVTTLVLKESPSGCIGSIVAPSKGREDYVVRRFIELTKLWGNQKIKIVIKSDGENSIKALAKLVQQRRETERMIDADASNAGTIIEEAPTNDSASMGGAEKAVQEVEGHVRTWLSHMECKLKTTIEGKLPIIAWLIEHVSTVINRTKVGSDGKTA